MNNFNVVGQSVQRKEAQNKVKHHNHLMNYP